MRVTFWGTRGSMPVTGAGTIAYGGNTSCVQVHGPGDNVVILDAGTGITALGASLGPELGRVDVLLTHLHMDHILGLGFFTTLFRPDHEVHIWGPASTTMDLGARLTRYLSPPLFPVLLRDLACRLQLHDVPLGSFEIPGFSVTADLVCHPGPTVGYRLTDGTGTLCYLPDHEPVLGGVPFGRDGWTSGLGLADGVDLLIHDAQYTVEQYAQHVGWGHSAVPHTLAFAETAGVRHLVPFHHDPRHDDKQLDELFDEAVRSGPWSFDITPAREGVSQDVRHGGY